MMEYLKNYSLSEQEQLLIYKASQKFNQMVSEYKQDIFGLLDHLEQLQKWAKFSLDVYGDMDPLVLFLSIRLHDIGHYPVTDVDHAVKWEIITKKFLAEEWTHEWIIEKVAHCVRSHRNRDVTPETLEAQMMACIDSASHLTDPLMYMSILKSGRFEYLDGKIDRDYRDVQSFLKIHEKVEPFYSLWKQLIQEHKKFTF